MSKALAFDGLSLLALSWWVALGPATSAFAQSDQPPARVEITGSRIPRLDAETALPVQTITRTEIRMSGATRVQDLLERITAAVGNWGEAQSVGNDNLLGASMVSLRGLGSKSTLVLLNGRRLATYAVTGSQDSGVDLHMIPLAAIDRVEVLKDGASAIYGSEAIGGVINFILRSDFTGAEVNWGRGLAEHGGAALQRGGFALGAGQLARNGWNVFAALDYRRSEALFGQQRAFAATAYDPSRGLNNLSPNSFPANVALGRNRYANPAAPDCPQPSTVLLRGGCLYDYVPTANLETPVEHTGLLARGTWQLAGDAQAFVEGVGSIHRQLGQSSPTPLFAAGNAGGRPIVLPVSSPYYPTDFVAALGKSGALVDLRYRTVALGPRTSVADASQGRLLVGVKGTLRDWSYDAAAGISSSTVRQTYVRGFVSSDAVIAGVDAGLINPFGDSGAAGNAALQGAQLTGLARNARNRARQFDLRASTDLAEWAAGTVSLSLGTEAHSERLDDLTYPIASAVAGGSTRSPKSGSRSAVSTYAELLTPLAKGLEAQWALRYDHYDDFGGTLNPKVAFRWQPTRQWLMRASAGTGFRAPSLAELYTAQEVGSIGDNGRPDPLRCPTTGLESDCNLQIQTVMGGNPDLKAERSTQATLGFGFSPVKEATLTVDTWTISQRNSIIAVTGTIFGDPFFERWVVVRGPPDPAYPNLPGPILRTVQINQNLGSRRTDGTDLALRWQTDMPQGWGRLNLRLDASYLSKAELSTNGKDVVSVLGLHSLTSTPRWTHNVGLGWADGPLRTELSQAFRGGYLGPTQDDAGTRSPVSPYQRWDLNLGYDLPATAWGAGRIGVGVRNLFDRSPPYVSPVAFQLGYDPSYADARGRYWTFDLSWRYK